MEVRLSKNLIKELSKKNPSIPLDIQRKAQRWVDYVRDNGIKETRKIKAYSDHSLKGNRKGQNSIYLSKLWRFIYILKDKEIYIEVIEITPHKY